MWENLRKRKSDAPATTEPAPPRAVEAPEDAPAAPPPEEAPDEAAAAEISPATADVPVAAAREAASAVVVAAAAPDDSCTFWTTWPRPPTGAPDPKLRSAMAARPTMVPGTTETHTRRRIRLGVCNVTL